MNQPKSVALIGYRGTGKSHVARLLGERLGWPVVDSDAEVEKAAGCAIVEIFAQQGEPAFRQLEEEQIARLTSASHQVLSLGGGAILSATTRRHLAERAFIVWLTASPRTLAARLAADTTTSRSRPSLTGKDAGQEIAEVLAARMPLYQACAQLTVDTEDRTPEEVAEAIFCQLPWNPSKKV